MAKECKTCGAIYELEQQDYPMRDKDTIYCQYCGREIISWNAGVIYSISYISEPTKQFKKIEKHNK